MFETKFSTSDEVFDTDFANGKESFGTQIQTGIKGGNGLSAYEVAVKNGFIGTEAEWLESLRGANGDDGHTPEKGVDYFTESDKAEIVNSVRDSLEYETWTFTLMDGTVFERKMVIK